MENISINISSNKNPNFPSQFCLGRISKKFEYIILKFEYIYCKFEYIHSKVQYTSQEVSFKEKVYGFSVDYDAIDKSNLLNIPICLMIKNSKFQIWKFQKNVYQIISYHRKGF